MADQAQPLVELVAYTDRVRIQGQVALPYRRAIDMLNSDDREYISIERATVAPLTMPSQVTGPNTYPTVLHRLPVILAGLDEQGAAPLADDTAATRQVRTPCLGFIGAFVFHGHVPLLPSQRLLDVMETQRNPFMLFYDTTVYLAERPDLPPYRHAGLIVNLSALEVIYLLQ